MKVLSKPSIYGIRALLYLASRTNERKYTGIHEISDNLDISFHFLTKIFQELTNQNILISYRGPNGGIALKQPADKVMLIDIILILEGDQFFEGCVLGLSSCQDTKPCPVHEIWKKVKMELKSEFEKVSLAELANKVKGGEFRLTG